MTRARVTLSPSGPLLDAYRAAQRPEALPHLTLLLEQAMARALRKAGRDAPVPPPPHPQTAAATLARVTDRADEANPRHRRV